MDLINATNQKIIATKLKVAKNFEDHFLGMILRKNRNGMIFKTRWGIHTFFVKRPIDVILLDNDNNIIKIKEKLSPFHLFCYPPKYSMVIELPEGSVGESNLRLGDKIKFA